MSDFCCNWVIFISLKMEVGDIMETCSGSREQGFKSLPDILK